MKILQSVFASFGLMVMILLFTGCSDSVDGDDDSQSPGELELTGTVENYDGNSYDLWASYGFDDLGRGEISDDGSIEIALWSGDVIDDALVPIGDTLDDFRLFPCIGEENFMTTDPDARFVSVAHFVFGPEGNALALTDQTEGFVDRTFPRIQSGSDETRIKWVYADRAVQIEAECERQRGNVLDQSMVDLDLAEGWNEIIYDHRDRSDLKVTQGTRPNRVNWYTDWGL